MFIPINSGSNVVESQVKKILNAKNAGELYKIICESKNDFMFCNDGPKGILILLCILEILEKLKIEVQ